MRTRRWLSAGLMLVALAGVAAGRAAGTRAAPDSIPVGMGPSAIAVDAPAGHAFVANSGDDTVTMFDTRSGAVLRTVAVGHTPLSLVVDAHTHRAFVLNAGSNSLSMLDTLSGAVRHTLHFPDLTALALDDQSGRLFVAGLSGQRMHGTLSMFDARRGTLLHTAAIGGPPGGWLVQSLAIDARHHQGWIANCGNGTVSLFNTRSGRVMRTLTIGGCPIGIALATRAGRAFVSNLADQTVRLLDARSGVPLRAVGMETVPTSLTVDEHTARVFVASSGDDTVSVLDARTGTLRQRIALGASGVPGACSYEAGLGATCTSLVTVAVDARHGRAFVLAGSGLGALQSSAINGRAGALEGRVTVLNAASGLVRRTLAVGLDPTALAVDETTEHLFVLNSQAAATTDTAASGGIRAAWLWGWMPVWLRQGVPWLSQPAPPAPPGPDGSVAVFDLSRL